MWLVHSLTNLSNGFQNSSPAWYIHSIEKNISMMAWQELVLNSSSSVLPFFSTIFIFIEILTYHILTFCLVCWTDFLVWLFWLLIECIWVYQKAFHTSPSHTLCLCLHSSPSSILLLSPPVSSNTLTADLHWAHMNSPQFCWTTDTGSEGESPHNFCP